MKAFAAMLAFLVASMIVSPAVSAKLTYHGIETSINDDLSASTKVTLKFSEVESHLDYYTNLRISNLKIGGSFGPVSCIDAPAGDGTKISCSLSGISGDKNTLYLEFETKNAVNYSYGRYHYDASYTSSLAVESFFSLIKLPESANLAGFPSNTSYSPAYGNTMTDGRNIMVIWDGKNVEAGQSLSFRVEYNLPPIRGSVTRYILIGAGIVIVVVIIIAFLYTRKASKLNKSKVIASVLSADEKRVVDILTAGSGSSLQKHIVRESGFSKAKVSRLVKSLGGRGIIRVEPVSGRENRIVLITERGKEKSAEKKEENHEDKSKEA